jgi:hypothetical protein
MNNARLAFNIVSECCPVGCSIDVFLAKSRKDGHIYSYCWACGVMWRYPLEARLGATTGEAWDPREHLPQGFALPTDTEIVTAGLSEYVLYESQNDYCREYFETELNRSGAAAPA